MEPGIFTIVFPRPTLEATFDAVAATGLRAVQCNFSCAGLPEMPEQVEPELARRIGTVAASRGVRIAAVSGTYNMAHPDPAERQNGLRRLRVIAHACGALGAPVITLCSGTRDPAHMWRRHPANDSPEAWRDMLDSLTAAAQVAEEEQVTMAFEPEPGNIITSGAKAKAALHEVGSSRLGVVMDAANLADRYDTATLRAALDDAFAAVGDRVLLAHAKDRNPDGSQCPAGRGTVPWDRYVELLDQAGFGGALVLHGLGEADVPASAAFLRGRLERG